MPGNRKLESNQNTGKSLNDIINVILTDMNQNNYQKANIILNVCLSQLTIPPENHIKRIQKKHKCIDHN